ncbi:MAG TPA: MarC family protein [Gammaproteobacteria bacterium]|nr:MarC family protein [Gammaproteobacteria bacterium]
MTIDYIQLSKQLVSLIVVLAPIDVMPLYLSLTRDMTIQQRNRILRRMILTVIVTLLFFQYSGLYLFSVIGISLPSFQVAGGLILASMAWSMLHATHSRIQTTPEGQEYVDREDISIVPLGIPMLAGPGTITTVILYAQQQQGNLSGHIQLSATILVTALVLYILFRLAGPLFDKLGPTGARVATRIMGMLLLALAAEFVLKGISATFAG